MRTGSAAISSGTMRTNGTSCRSLRYATEGQSRTSPRTCAGELRAASRQVRPPRLLPISTAGRSQVSRRKASRQSPR